MIEKKEIWCGTKEELLDEFKILNIRPASEIKEAESEGKSSNYMVYPADHKFGSIEQQISYVSEIKPPIGVVVYMHSNGIYTSENSDVPEVTATLTMQYIMVRS